MKAGLLLLALLAAAALAPPAAAETIGLAGTGLTMERPEGWVQVSARQNLDYLDRTGVGSPALRNRMAGLTGVPFLSFVKNNGHRLAMPTVRVQVQPRAALPDLPPAQIVRGAFEIIAHAVPGAEIVEGPAEWRALGPGGAFVRIAYVFRTAAEAMPVRSQMWVVTRGDLIFSFSITMAQDEPESVWREAEAILATVRIEAPGASADRAGEQE